MSWWFIQVIILNIKSDGNIDEQYESAKKRARQIADKILSYVPERRERKEYGELKVNSNVTKEEFMDTVERAKEYIVNGDIFQIVLSQRFEIDNPPDSFDVYRMLRATNPSPYLYYFKTPDYHIAGASPEMLVNVTDGIVKTKPIAGTIYRVQTKRRTQSWRLYLTLTQRKEQSIQCLLI